MLTSLEPAIARLETFFSTLDTRPGVIARRPWGEVNLFHMLESLLLAGIRPARAVIARAVPALLARQQPDGSFDDVPREERALIGLRSLLVAHEG
jgi:hypothetical protein